MGTNIFSIKNNLFLCIVNYHSKFPVVERAEDVSVEHLLRSHKIVFTDYVLPCRVISDSGINFISDKSKTLFQKLNIDQSTSLSYNHQSNCHAETCNKYVNRTTSRTGRNKYSSLTDKTHSHRPEKSLKILFNRPIKGILLKVNR